MEQILIDIIKFLNEAFEEERVRKHIALQRVVYFRLNKKNGMKVLERFEKEGILSIDGDYVILNKVLIEGVKDEEIKL